MVVDTREMSVKYIVDETRREIQTVKNGWGMVVNTKKMAAIIRQRGKRGGSAAHHLQDEVGPPLALEVGPPLAPPLEGLPSPFGHNG